MKQLMIAFALVIVPTLSAKAQDPGKARLEKSPRHQEWVKAKHGSREVDCFVVFPEVKEKAPAVLVIHEIFGLSDWARGLTDQLAEAGYVAIAPDLLSGMGPNGGGTSAYSGRDAVTRAVSTLPAQQVTDDLRAAAEYVVKLPACNGKLSVAGFCWGGGQSFRFATNYKDLKAAYVFYGPGPKDEQAVQQIQCPVYGFYAGNDARIDATIPATTDLMKKAGKTFEPVTYEGAGHGFMRAGEAADASAGNKKARDEAWQRWKKLLKEN